MGYVEPSHSDYVRMEVQRRAAQDARESAGEANARVAALERRVAKLERIVIRSDEHESPDADGQSWATVYIADCLDCARFLRAKAHHEFDSAEARDEWARGHEAATPGHGIILRVGVRPASP